MWWVVHRRMNKRNLNRDCENKRICELGKDLEEILKGRLETIEEEPEAEERERLGDSHKPMLVKAKMKVEKGKSIVKAKVKSGKVFYMLCVIGLASKRGFNDLPPHLILRHDNYNQTDLISAMTDMRRQSYNGFVILLRFLNDTNYFRNTDITFLMPSDNDISHADITPESLETFILKHTIPAWLMINHMLHFPNRTLVPCSFSDRMFTITKSGGSGIYVNNARIVTPNVCQNSRISCHGISDVISFNQNYVSTKMLPSVRRNITSSKH
ncbi:Fasciclin-like arabinogalactan family protein [Arabidopsis thaliana]|uniref:Fasciclin-like arabinogalactan family protein n=1 Tax=Arabidopsis thaliana TaxID=3702 RepID=F4K185_ARATH|nr:Fasciclin-like arabinogalactan family protein [Arabidopsis thaliana]AED93571.1 Fasciclin-like arabinogalactan family protein [Arabidopsis thaliana]|eukprot:NP_850872.1 Fasciclin-like arabinogalactan family protein [Arabidopsis thaliana]